MKNVIVTGGNGFIGSSLIKKLVANGVNVVAVDITFAGDRLPESEFITKIESGVDVSLAKKIPSGEYDAFYHLAWRGVNVPIRQILPFNLQIFRWRWIVSTSASNSM